LLGRCGQSYILLKSLFDKKQKKSCYHGFGFDHVREDIKIIRHTLFSRIDGHVLRQLGVQRKDVSWNEKSYEPLWEIYSQRYNSWRILYVNMPVCLTDSSNQQLYMDEICH